MGVAYRIVAPRSFDSLMIQCRIYCITHKSREVAISSNKITLNGRIIPTRISKRLSPLSITQLINSPIEIYAQHLNKLITTLELRTL